MSVKENGYNTEAKHLRNFALGILNTNLMHRYTYLLMQLLFAFIFCSPMCYSKLESGVSLQEELKEYVTGKDATIGIAVIIDRTDTVQVNGNRYFPMLSVYKFPIAFAFGEYLQQNSVGVSDTISIHQTDLKPDTFSPMREKYGKYETFQLPVYELLAYAVQQSDNNASDILLNIIGGVNPVVSVLRRHGISDVHVGSSEAQMYANNQLCYDNVTTPIAMAQLLDIFDNDFDDSYSRMLKQLMEGCETGKNRIPKPLTAANAVIGHKTGTGFPLQDGRLMAVNDAGYVHLSNGRCYSIAVFVENSGYTLAETEEIIAGISEKVYDYLERVSQEKLEPVP